MKNLSSIDKQLKILVAIRGKFHSRLIVRELEDSLPKAIITTVYRYDVAKLLDREQFHVVVTDIDPKQTEDLNYLRSIRFCSPKCLLITLLEDMHSLSYSEIKAYRIDQTLHLNHYHFDEIPQSVIKLIQSDQSSTTGTPQKHINRNRDIELIKIATGSIAHELNNPLMTIIGVCELLLEKRKSLNPDLAKKINVIHKSAKRMKTALKKINNVSPAPDNRLDAQSVLELETSQS